MFYYTEYRSWNIGQKKPSIAMRSIKTGIFNSAQNWWPYNSFSWQWLINSYVSKFLVYRRISLTDTCRPHQMPLPNVILHVLYDRCLIYYLHESLLPACYCTIIDVSSKGGAWHASWGERGGYFCSEMTSLPLYPLTSTPCPSQVLFPILTSVTCLLMELFRHNVTDARPVAQE